MFQLFVILIPAVFSNTFTFFSTEQGSSNAIARARSTKRRKRRQLPSLTRMTSQVTTRRPKRWEAMVKTTGSQKLRHRKSMMKDFRSNRQLKPGQVTPGRILISLRKTSTLRQMIQVFKFFIRTLNELFMSPVSPIFHIVSAVNS